MEEKSILSEASNNAYLWWKSGRSTGRPVQ